MDDALNLARAGILDYPTALKVTEYLTEETKHKVRVEAELDDQGSKVLIVVVN